MEADYFKSEAFKIVCRSEINLKPFFIRIWRIIGFIRNDYPPLF